MKMNWTGGRLQRHSGNKGGLTKRQKQHFAKARTQLQNSTHRPSSSPFRPIFLQPGGIAESDILSSHQSQRPPKTLDQYDALAPITQRLSSLKPRHRTRNSDAGNNAARDRAARPPDSTNKRQTDISADIAAVSRNWANVGRESPRLREQGAHRRGETKTRHPTGIENEDALEREKKRLLANSDWVGLAPSKPLHMRFGSSKEKERIGKRHRIDAKRKLTSAHRNDRDSYDMPEVPKLETFLEDTRRGPFISGAIVNDLEDIRIRIGTEALATQQSPWGYEYESQQPARLDTQSDDMLLDDEEPLQLALVHQQSHGERDPISHLSWPVEENGETAPVHVAGAGEEQRNNERDNDIDDVDRLLEEVNRSSSMYPAQMPKSVLSSSHDAAPPHTGDRQDRQLKDSDMYFEKTCETPYPMPSNDYLGSPRMQDSVLQGRCRTPSVKPPRLFFRSVSFESNDRLSQLDLEMSQKEPQHAGSPEQRVHSGTIEQFDVSWRQLLELASDGSYRSQQTGPGRSEPVDWNVTSNCCGNSVHGEENASLDSERVIDEGLALNCHDQHEAARSDEPTHATAPHSSVAYSTLPQASVSISDGSFSGSLPASLRQIGTLAEEYPAAPPFQCAAIGDADEEAAEAVWKKFIFGNDNGYEERRATPEWGVSAAGGAAIEIAPSLLVNLSAAGSAAPPSPPERVHSVTFQRNLLPSGVDETDPGPASPEDGLSARTNEAIARTRHASPDGTGTMVADDGIAGESVGGQVAPGTP
ncbi:uncharacterized protein K452DRAFT_50648 [Aplosporella prunicola CBS 121167]|uniref:Uncharacterized protein n=1 Tax=Aplosporella prunicola CBS 121167 TaxID=1176127 RepID=A0A6A6B9M2_9PEZI|nr:uncharacterized protein K452DRAFT_50648 [Aplosporella prunicola CBS 121167]KAF2140736.1 hypothetical protein K452DRAFT_50648 [Aplosporella prunicola CBS 121167]